MATCSRGRGGPGYQTEATLRLQDRSDADTPQASAARRPAASGGIPQKPWHAKVENPRTLRKSAPGSPPGEGAGRTPTDVRGPPGSVRRGLRGDRDVRDAAQNW